MLRFRVRARLCDTALNLDTRARYNEIAGYVGSLVRCNDTWEEYVEDAKRGLDFSASSFRCCYRLLSFFAAFERD